MLSPRSGHPTAPSNTDSASSDTGELTHEQEITHLHHIIKGYETNEVVEGQKHKLSEYRTYKAYRALLALVPHLREKENELDEDAFEGYLSMIGKAGDAAKNMNMSKIRVAVVHWINKEIASDAETDPDTGACLCPVDLDGDWDEESFCQCVCNNEPSAQISSSWFFRALYATGTGHADDVETGFLHGPLLVKFCEERKHRQKYSTNQEDKDERWAIAHEIKCCTSLHFNLTDAEHWPQDGTYMAFNYHGLYNFLIDYFEQDATSDAAKQHVNELLNWWTA
ncbi:hypothetical protein FISHEDRAFT_58733 [Fistulina hepatica ATCC 64428]|uniref:Uncharacterized protein n=1 Tax=Fistulina hepatica ATCC 64428 TaxID=1128425 RepID=A0A0D7ACK2_9AGAR|nr:hypothetical protein FISHEDRAFT_58733 [Fistulina hepatica ATCC 64428]